MEICKLGLHNWSYAYEGSIRFCKKCKKKQELTGDKKWVNTDLVRRPANNIKFCECPRDYTVSIRLTTCPHCGLPRQPRIIRDRSASQSS
jgi:hypothetical protein